MGMEAIERRDYQATVRVASGGNLSLAIFSGSYAGGMLTTPATLDATTVIGFKVCDTETGTYVPLYDKNNNLVFLTVQLNAARGYPLPDELFGAPYFKIWTCTSVAVDVNQTGNKDFGLNLKA